MLNRSWWRTLRRAVQSTIAIVTAVIRAPLGPTMAAPASAPTAVTEIVPVRSTSIESACAAPTRATIASRAATFVPVAVSPSNAPIAMPLVPMTATSSVRRFGIEKNLGPTRACGRDGPGSVACGASSTDGTDRHLSGRQRRVRRQAPRRGAACAQDRLGEHGLVRRVEDAVAALDLRPVDGEVGLVDELVRVLAVARERGDAERDRRVDRLARGVDLELALGDRAPDALGDLERLLRLGLGQQDRELLAAEAGRDVVVAQLLAEDLRDAFEDGVAGEVAIGVVDVAQQVEVGHDQRHRPVEPLRPVRAPRGAWPRSAGRCTAPSSGRCAPRPGARGPRASGGSARAARARTGSATG